MSDSGDDRLSEHLMIPILIEQDLDDSSPGEEHLLHEIRGRLQTLIPDTDNISEELIEYLLRRRRILVIVDDLSEMSDSTRHKINPLAYRLRRDRHRRREVHQG